MGTDSPAIGEPAARGARAADVGAAERLVVPLVGQPIAYSLSPVFQQAAFDHAGIAARYELWETAPADLAARVARLREPGYLGANVTVPHKEAVLPLLDLVAPLAARIGAVNTIVKDQGRLRGENTDAGGFIAPLRERGVDFAAWRAVLLGAGGAARAVAFALLDAGVRELAIANRTLARAATLAAALADRRARVHALSDPALGQALASAALLVDATAGGWQGAPPALAPELLARLPAEALVYDLTYQETPLLRLAAARGLTTLDGFPMLIEQGALAWEHWTGRTAPREVMWAAARTARAAREGRASS